MSYLWWRSVLQDCHLGQRSQNTGIRMNALSQAEFSFLQNFNTENPNCVGIEGVLEAYFQSLRTVQLYGPTNFAPVINQVARWDSLTHTLIAMQERVLFTFKLTQETHNFKCGHNNEYISSLIHKICKFPCVSDEQVIHHGKPVIV